MSLPSFIVSNCHYPDLLFYRAISMDVSLDDSKLSASDLALLKEFGELWNRAEAIWDSYQQHSAFESYVSADYHAVFHALISLREQKSRFIEWGSGLGVVTIMADRLGYEAVGIEAKDLLVDFALDLADDFQSEAEFSVGSFIPDRFEWDPASGDESIRTIIDIPDGYDQLGIELRDFDLVYSYPWPTEHALYHNVMREFADPNSVLLTYDAREGLGLVQFADLGF